MGNTYDPNRHLEKLAKGDHLTISTLYKETFPKIAHFIIRNNGRKYDAEDIFQNALIQIIARYRTGTLVLTSAFEAYFFTVCRNLWIRELNLRKRRVIPDAEIHLTIDDHDTAMAILEQEKWELFQEKMDSLSENCREVLAFFFKNFSSEHIMKEMGYNSVNVIRQRIFKCKKKLTEMIKSDTRYQMLK